MLVNIITKNPDKLAVAKSVFSKFGIEVNQITKDFPEIQADASLEIARYTAIQASKELNIPVIREDHSLIINALGIPGRYTSFIERRLSVNKLLKLLDNEKDRSGYFEIATVYAEPSGLIKEYSYRVPVFFETQERVPDPRKGWNGIIRLAEESRTFTEYPAEERLHVWGRNYESIARFLNSRKNPRE
ncbi:MAG TPA: hypothetical protein ENG48_04985 [Candidatus Atribacteria bacterium]|nr:hypothetical protein [Candidatus Atribacteria bacterium]